MISCRCNIPPKIILGGDIFYQKFQPQFIIQIYFNMKRNIRKIAILMLIVTLLCTAVSVSAVTNPPISTRSVCVYCGRGTVVTKCWGDYTYYTTGKGMHLPSSNCSVSFYKATAKEWCSSCYKVNADLGKHDCYQIHSSCGRGKMWTCIADISAGGDWMPN